MPSVLGSRVAALRKAKKLSGKKLADMLNVTQSYISYIENMDNPSPNIDIINKMSKIFDVSTDYLLGKSDSPKLLVSAPQMGGVYQKRDSSPVFDTSASRGDVLRIPILSREKSACCGAGFPNSSEIYAEMTDYLDMPSALVGVVSTDAELRPYFMYADGDSMIRAGIMDGFFVLVNPAEPVYDGDSALVEYGIDGNIAIKRVYWLSDGAVKIASADGTGWTRIFTREEIDQGIFKTKGKIMFAGQRPKKG